MGISGREVTPFILKRVNELTKGKSLEANLALVQNNAAVGAQIACELAKLKEQAKNTEGDASHRVVSAPLKESKENTEAGKRPVR